MYTLERKPWGIKIKKGSNIININLMSFTLGFSLISTEDEEELFAKWKTFHVIDLFEQFLIKKTLLLFVFLDTA